MKLIKYACYFLLIGILLVTAGVAKGQLALPFTAKAATGGGVEVVNSTDPQLETGDVITFVAEFGGTPVQVAAPADLLTKVLDRLDTANRVAVWRSRAGSNDAWTTITLVAAAPAASGAHMAPRELGGITLPAGFQFVPKPAGRHGEVWGGIRGPGNQEIEFSIWPVAQPGEPRTGGHFVSDAKRYPEDDRQWFKEHYSGDELVQMTLSNSNRLIVSYPSRGINLSSSITGNGQFADALLIALSIPNETRGLSWTDAQSVIENGDVDSVYQSHSLNVVIRMSDGTRYRTTEPKIDAIVDVLKRAGKLDSVGFATE